MYVVSQLLSRMGQLLQVGTPEADDAVIKLPNTVLEPIPFPLSIPSNQGVTYSDSFSILAQTTITNAGGGSVTNVCTLVAGVWRLNFFIDNEFNWLNANPIAQDNRIVLTQNLVTNIEIWSAAAKVSRTTQEFGPLVFTLPTAMAYRLIQNGNGVGQTSTLNVHLHAARLL